MYILHHLWDVSLHCRLSITANTNVMSVCFHNFRKSCADMSRAMLMDQHTKGYISKMQNLLDILWVCYSLLKRRVNIFNPYNAKYHLTEINDPSYIPAQLPTAIEWLYAPVYHKMVTLQVMVCQVETSSELGKPITLCATVNWLLCHI